MHLVLLVKVYLKCTVMVDVCYRCASSDSVDLLSDRHWLNLLERQSMYKGCSTFVAQKTQLCSFLYFALFIIYFSELLFWWDMITLHHTLLSKEVRFEMLLSCRIALVKTSGIVFFLFSKTLCKSRSLCEGLFFPQHKHFFSISSWKNQHNMED